MKHWKRGLCGLLAAVLMVPAGLAANEAAQDGGAVAGVLAPGGGNGDAHVRLSGEEGLDQRGGLDRGFAQVGRQQQDVTGRTVGAVAHGGDLHARFDGRGAPTLDGVANDDGARGSGGPPGVVGGAIVDDNEKVNAGYSAARAHGGRDGATDVVCGDDCSDALRVGTSRSAGIVHTT